MKKTKILCGVVLGMMTLNAMAVTVEQRKALCLTDPDGHVWVEKTGACIEVDPCSSADNIVRDTYCVRNFADIDMDVDSFSAKARNTNDACTTYDAYTDGDWQYNQEVGKCPGLNKGEWSARFYYGTVKGRSTCAKMKGDSGTLGSPNTNEPGRHCWCQAVEFIKTNGGVQNLDTSAWAHVVDLGVEGTETCQETCASLCARRVAVEAEKREAIFEASK